MYFERLLYCEAALRSPYKNDRRLVHSEPLMVIRWGDGKGSELQWVEIRVKKLCISEDLSSTMKGEVEDDQIW